MLGDFRYCNYPNGEQYVKMFFSAMFRRKTRVLGFIEKLIQHKGVGITEELECFFASEYDVTDPEYFGNTGVVLYAYPPASEQNLAILISEENFYKILSEYIEKNFNAFNADGKKALSNYNESIRNMKKRQQ